MLLLIIIPVVIYLSYLAAQLISKRLFNQLVSKRNRNARTYSDLSFIISFLIIFSAIGALLVLNIRIER